MLYFVNQYISAYLKNFFDIRTGRSAFCYMKYTENSVPDKKQDEGAEYCGADIDKNRGETAGSGGNVPEDNLLHGIVRINIKHVDRTIFVQIHVNAGGDQAAGEIKRGASRKRVKREAEKDSAVLCCIGRTGSGRG